jgi:hypothetical protein
MANNEPVVPLAMVKLSCRLLESRKVMQEWFYLSQKLACRATTLVGRTSCRKYKVFENHTDALVPRNPKRTGMTIAFIRSLRGCRRYSRMRRCSIWCPIRAAISTQCLWIWRRHHSVFGDAGAAQQPALLCPMQMGRERRSTTH